MAGSSSAGFLMAEGVSPGNAKGSLQGMPASLAAGALVCVCPGEFAYSLGFGLGFRGLKRHLQCGWGPALEPTVDLGPRATLQPPRSSLRDERQGCEAQVFREPLCSHPSPASSRLSLVTHTGAFATEPHLVGTRLHPCLWSGSVGEHRLLAPWGVPRAVPVLMSEAKLGNRSPFLLHCVFHI